MNDIRAHLNNFREKDLVKEVEDEILKSLEKRFSQVDIKNIETDESPELYTDEKLSLHPVPN